VTPHIGKQGICVSVHVCIFHIHGWEGQRQIGRVCFKLGFYEINNDVSTGWSP
jgi:hypothetical protein